MALVLFAADDGVHGTELWAVDPATGLSRMVKDINPNGSSAITEMGSENGLAYFGASDGTNTLVWRSDGTTVGTYAISSPTDGGAPSDLFLSGGLTYFTGADSLDTGLFVMNGQVGGTSLIANSGSETLGVAAVDNKLLFESPDGSGGTTLSVTGGNLGSYVVALADFAGQAGQPTAAPSIINATLVDPDVYFQVTVNGQDQLWATDGFPNSAVEIFAAGSGQAIGGLIEGDGKFYFEIMGPNAGVYEASAASNSQVLVAAAPIAQTLDFSINNHLIYVTGLTTTSYQINSLDEVTGATTVLATVSDYLNGQMAAVGSELFFVVGGVNDGALWVTDGTAAGTHVAIDQANAGVAVTGEVGAVGSQIVFEGWDQTHGSQLWVTDGTVVGTHMLTSGLSIGSFASLAFLPNQGFSAVANDFNGDGHSDLLFANAAGLTTEWTITGGSSLTETPNAYTAEVAPSWQVQGSMDVNGDGMEDLVWRNGASGVFSIWESTGSSFTPNAIVGQVDPGWTMAGFGDFSGDGKDDILWRNITTGTFAIWTSTGAGFTPNTYVDNSVDTSWHIQAVADFNGDGKADILFRNSAGVITEWQSNSSSYLGQVHTNGSGFTQNVFVTGVDPSWHVAAVGDFNGDGKDDLIFRNDSGLLTEWQSTGPGFAQNVYVAQVDPSWALVGAYDFNGDGKADLLFRNSSTGTFTVWESTGSGFTPNVLVDGSVSSAWQIVTHHYDTV